jgi:putative ABC transport system permease protein
MIETLRQDIRYALRTFRKTPGFTLVAAVTLALGIGANVAIFSAVHGVLLRPLPYPEPDRLVAFWARWENEGFPRVSTVGGDFREYQRQATLFEGIAAVGSIRQNVTGGGEPIQIQVGWVTRNLFSVMKVRPILGRDFAPDEGTRSLILSYGFWQSYFAGDREVLGRSVNLDGQPFTIIGVLPADFELLMAANAGISTEIDAWKPPDPTANPARWVSKELNNSMLRPIARMKHGVTLAQAQAEMDAVAEHLRNTLADHARMGFFVNVEPLHHEVVGHVRPTLLALLGAVGVVLLIACANVANLLLVRAQGRQKEIAIRVALGGRPGRIARQLLTESLVLGALGGVAGLVLGYGGIRFLLALQPAKFPRLESIAIDGTVLAFTMIASLVATAVFGLAPTVRAIRWNLNEALTQRSPEAGGSRRSRMSQLLIVAEVALSLMLLVGAGLLMRSFVRLQEVRPGFDAGNLLTFSVSVPSDRYPPPQESAAFFKRFEERIQTLPGVLSVGTVWPLPLEGQIWAGPYATPRVADDDSHPMADYRLSTPGYAPTMGARLVEGRYFREEDQGAVLVDQNFAQLNWPSGTAVGQKLKAAPIGPNLQEFQVVGVVENIRHADLKSDGRETVYLPARAFTWADWEMAVTVRTATDPLSLVEPVRKELESLDPQIPMAKIRAMEDYVSDAVAPNRFALILIAIFAAVAVTLAAIGLYGVISYAIGQRTREIGIRIAFGAPRARIFRLVVGQGLGLTLIGVALGVIGSFLLGGLISSLLFDVPAEDPLTYAATAGLLILVALAACFIPARRATRVDPILALRAE